MESSASVIQAFQDLKDNDSRTAALDALTRLLTPYEWRHLADRLQTRTFQTDIVGGLPTELVAQIFDSLDISAPFRLRAVSKRWCAHLRSPAVWKSGVMAWYDGHIESGLDDAAYLLKARAIQNFRTGTWTDVTLWTTNNCKISDTAFCEDRFAHVGSTGREVHLMDLRPKTPGLCTVRGYAMEIIARTTLSDRFIAFTTLNKLCYVFDLAGNRKAMFHIHPHMDQVFTSRGPALICGGVHPTTGADLYVWNLETQRGTSWNIPIEHRLFKCAPGREQCKLRRMAVLPNPDSQTVTIFTSEACERRHCTDFTMPCFIYYSRFTFDGIEKDHGTFNLLPIHGVRVDGLFPVDRRGGFALRLKEIVFPLPNSFGEEARMLSWGQLMFDEKTFTFQDPNCPLSSPMPPYLVPGQLQWWKDIFYRAWPPATEAKKLTKYGSNHIVPLARVSTSDSDKLVPWETGVSRMAEEALEPFHLNDKYAVILSRKTEDIYIVTF